MSRMKEWLPLWNLAQHNGIIAIACKKCGHRGFVTAKSLLNKRGTRIIGLMTFKCTHCGCTDTDRRAYIPMTLANT